MPSVDRGATPRRRKKWTDEEDLRLLEAIEHYGFGNWEDVAKSVGTKSPEDSKERYLTTYLQGTIGESTWKDIKSESQLVDHMPAEIPKVCQPTDPTSCRDQLTEEELIQLGYMPNSDDYMFNHDQEAEKIVSNLTVNKDDDDLDIALKMALLCAYNRRIAERLRRKRIAREYGLQVKFFKQPTEDDQEKQELEDRLRVFAQLMPESEHSALVANLWGERSAQRRLHDLYRYRRHGVTRFDECEHFEQHYALRQMCQRRSIRLKQRTHAPKYCRSRKDRRDSSTDSIYIYG